MSNDRKLQAICDAAALAFPDTGSPAGSVVSLGPAEELLTLIDQELAGRPREVDLLMAKVSALCRMMQNESAETVIDEVLRIDRDNLDARQKKLFWTDWHLVFDLPAWDESSTSAGPLYASALGSLKASGIRIYLARTGFKPSLVVVQSADGLKFKRPITTNMRSMLMVKLAPTPYGPVAPYYLFLEDDPYEYFRREAFLTISGPARVVTQAESGYWIVQRLARDPECYIVFVEGTRVLYNRQFRLPESEATQLRTAAADLLQHPPPMDIVQVQQSWQWYMEHSSWDDVRFPDRAHAPEAPEIPSKQLHGQRNDKLEN